jgi:hypothetical protein
MVRKSLVNDWFSHESPGVQCERPHHFQTLGRRREGFGTIHCFLPILKVNDAASLP